MLDQIIESIMLNTSPKMWLALAVLIITIYSQMGAVSAGTTPEGKEGRKGEEEGKSFKVNSHLVASWEELKVIKLEIDSLYRCEKIPRKIGAIRKV